MLRGAQLALVTGLAVLAAAPAAHALTVARDGNTIRIDAAPGEINNVGVFDNAGDLAVNDDGPVPISPGAGCMDIGGNTVECGAVGTVTGVVANLGDMADAIVHSVPAPATVDGGPGDDGLFTDAGNTAAPVNDSIVGGSGNDDIIGYGGDDTLDGGIGSDVISGALGNDTLLGNDGDDRLDDLAGSNTLSGGDGDDSLSGGIGNDQLLGGPGSDNVLGNGELDGADVADGGPGTDSAFAFNEGEPLTISLDGAANDGAAGQGANYLAVEHVGGGTANDQISGSAGPDDLTGGDGSDVVDGLGGNDYLQGNAENDALIGGAGSDDLDGGSGDDALSGGDGDDGLYGRLGADDLAGGTGRDTVNWGDGGSYDAGATVTLDDVADDGAFGEGDNAHSDNENVIGTGGPDVIFGTAGRNTITGGEGPDLIVLDDGGPASASRDHALCGPGEDTVRVDPLDAVGVKEELCENVQYGPLAGWGPTLAVTAFGRGVLEEGVLPLELGCPFRARGGCEGTVTLRVGGRRAGRVRFSLEAGETGERSLRLSRAVRRALRRGRVRGTLVSSVQDEIGATQTSQKSVTLRP